MEEELKLVSRYVEQVSPMKIMDLYSNLFEGRQRMIDPIFYTHKGERVRSKSEVIIANLLYKYQIPYRYEFPLTIKDFGITYPDFLILNVRKKRKST